MDMIVKDWNLEPAGVRMVMASKISSFGRRANHTLIHTKWSILWTRGALCYQVSNLPNSQGGDRS